MYFKNNIGIIVIIFLFFCSNLIFLGFYDDVWWDSSIYIGMGKYIYSFGDSGLWEASRPLILPLFLGVGWFLDFNAVYFGRAVSITFAILVLYMVYIIGIRLFSKKVGLLAAFFTAFSYHFLFFSPSILTEIPSTLFVLLAFYFFLEKKFFLTGLFSGISVMTRLFQVFTLIGLVLVFFIYFFRKKDFKKNLLYFITGASLFIFSYILINYYLYGDVLTPLKIQLHLTKTTGWALYHGFGFYFLGLLKENFFIIFLLTLPFFIKKDYKFFTLIFIPLIYILIFSFVAHKEMRFMLVVLPFLYLLLSYCLAQIYLKIKYRRLALGLFFILVAVWLSVSFSYFNDTVSYRYQREDEGLLYFQKYLMNNEGEIWVTSPLYALYSDERIEGLLYYYSSENLINFINKNSNTVDIILFNSCDIQCHPDGLDPLCRESRELLKDTISNFDKIYQNEINSCNYQIFRKTTS